MKQFNQHNNKIGLGYKYTFFYLEETDEGNFRECYLNSMTKRLTIADYDEDERSIDSIEILTTN